MLCQRKIAHSEAEHDQMVEIYSLTVFYDDPADPYGGSIHGLY